MEAQSTDTYGSDDTDRATGKSRVPEVLYEGLAAVRLRLLWLSSVRIASGFRMHARPPSFINVDPYHMVQLAMIV